MKRYMKPAAEAMETEAQQILAVSIYTDNESPAKQGAGDKYSDGLAKAEKDMGSSFWD